MTNQQSTTFIDIDRFNGEDKDVSLEGWLNNIQLCAEVSGWPIKTIVRLVRARAIGTAGRRLHALQEDYASMPLLIQDIKKILSIQRDPKLGFQQLVRAGQKKDEKLQDLADRVRRAVKDMNNGVMSEATAVSIFTSALQDGNTRMHVSMNEKETLQETLDEALRFQRRQEWAFAEEKEKSASLNFSSRQQELNSSIEPMEIDALNRQGFQRGRGRPFDGRNFSGQQQLGGTSASKAPREDQTCYYCDKKGHLSMDCATRARHMDMLKRFQDKMQRRKFTSRFSGSSRGRGRGRGARATGRVQEMELSESDRQLKELADLLEQHEEDDEMFDDVEADEGEEPETENLEDFQ